MLPVDANHPPDGGPDDLLKGPELERTG
jgi:hypothetical protein